MTYTIEQVSPAVKEYDSKFGQMKSYQVKFQGNEMWVDISQKPSTPVPTVGQQMEGTIDVSGPYGAKFKKAFGGGAIAPARGPKTEFDNFTMYLSYAKDLVVALQTTSGYDSVEFGKLLEATIKGGKALYDRRPGAPAPPEPIQHPFAGDTGQDMDEPMSTDLLDPFKEVGGFGDQSPGEGGPSRG